MILTIRTDGPVAELGLVESGKQKAYKKWKADRKLSQQIHKEIEQLLHSQKTVWRQISGIVFYEGPGSFTGLRIGAAVTNAVVAQLGIPVAQAAGDEWIKTGLGKLSNESKQFVTPEYGRPARITKPRK